jgi:hypothetical protein
MLLISLSLSLSLSIYIYMCVCVCVYVCVYNKISIKMNSLTIKNIQREVGQSKDLSTPLRVNLKLLSNGCIFIPNNYKKLAWTQYIYTQPTVIILSEKCFRLTRNILVYKLW